MNKKFYQMNITDFKCGWEETLQQAQKDFPNGTVMKLQDYVPSEEISIFYNPVGTYNKIIERWSTLCIEVKAIVDGGIKIEDLPKLLQLEILIYDLVLEYMLDQEYETFVNYKPKEFEDITPDFYDVYLEKDCFGLDIQEYKMF